MQTKTTSSVNLAWKRLKHSLSETEPKDLLRFVVISVCVLVVYVQVQECYRKVLDPPLTTHTQLQLKENMSYPALTICRTPPLNKRLYAKYNFTELHLGSIPLSSEWKPFPFDKYTLEDFYRETVYGVEYVSTANLAMSEKYIEITSTLHLTLGLCHTIRPRNITKSIGKTEGYSINLLHDLYNYNKFLDEEPGWQLYIHEAQEKFSENTEILSSRQDHVFLRTGESVEVNLEPTDLVRLKKCNDSFNYSTAECEEKCWIGSIAKQVNCSGPWLPTLKLPTCNEYVALVDLQRATYQMVFPNCCLPRCSMVQYKANVVSRSPINSTGSKLNLTQTTAYVYFTSKSVLSMKESYAYDWSQFMGDLGGSIGFLLGLSVLGIVGLLEGIIKILFGIPKSKKKIKEKEQNYPDLKFKVSSPSTLVAKFDRY